MAKATSDLIFGVIWQESWILDHFEIFIKGGIRVPLAKRRWWCHLANSFALAEVPVGYDCFSNLCCKRSSPCCRTFAYIILRVKCLK